MSNIPEETGKVLTSVIDSMKSQPMLILVLVLNGIFIGVSYFALEGSRTREATTVATVLGRCLPGHDKE